MNKQNIFEGREQMFELENGRIGIKSAASEPIGNKEAPQCWIT